MGSPCGPQTTTNVVAGSASSSETRLARSRNPSTIPLNAWKNSLRSVSRSRPVTRFSTLIAIELPRPTTLVARPVGFMNICMPRPSMNCVRRFGASRKSRALRDGGVSRTRKS